MNLKQIEYIGNDNNRFVADELLPCPFCGEEPIYNLIGNDHTRSRKFEIECSNCRASIIKAGIRASSEQIAKWSIEAWNKRTPTKKEAGV